MEIERKKFRDTSLFVYKDGRVYNEETNIYLKPSKTKLGYLRVHPHINKKHYNFFIARMVAEVWIANPDKKPFVLHNDNNPLNNHMDNLRWGTQSENIQQAYDEGRINADGENNGQSKLTTIQVLVMREAKTKGFQIRRIARYFKMNEHYISQICLGKRWGHI